jgi:hypothetical protein
MEKAAEQVDVIRADRSCDFGIGNKGRKNDSVPHD